MTTGPVRPEGFGQFKKNSPYRGLNPRPSGLQHSALTTTVPRAHRHRINGVSDFVHRPDSKELEDKNTTFRKLDLFPSSGDGRHLLCWVPQKKS
jgi:hypothetical protein